MTPSAPDAVRRRPGGRSARVRSQVLQAALEELVDKGYAGLGFEGVAQRAGVHRATLYRRWGTRDELLLEAMAEMAEEAVPIPDTGSVRGDLLAYASSVAGNVTRPEHQAVTRVFVAEAGRNPTLAAAGRQFWQERVDLAKAIVTRAVDRGELPQGTKPRRVVEQVLGPLYFRLLLTGDPLTKRFLADTVDLALTALRTTSTAEG